MFDLYWNQPQLALIMIIIVIANIYFFFKNNTEPS